MNTRTANLAWLKNLVTVRDEGEESSPRGKDIIELIGYSSRFSMRFPLTTIVNRKLSLQFAAAEALWILSGSDYLQPLLKHAPSMAKYSDDGIKLFGAYGPKVFGQMPHVISALASDHDSRQAVINIWRENPPPSKDIPCTCSVQWLIRDDTIHCVDNMRSSDLWLGWSYDVFTFTMVTAYIALLLRDRHGLELNLGCFTLNAGSQHIYKTNLEKVNACIADPTSVDYAPFNLSEFVCPDHLTQRLIELRDRRDLGSGSKFLQEVLYGD